MTDKHHEIPAHFFVPGMAGMERISCTDPFGSYTGLVEDPDEKPVQDADDL
jgi:hypothetical protein